MTFEAQFGGGQRAEAVALIERMAWGDLDTAIRDVEAVLRLALEGTDEDFERWEGELGPAFEADGYNEFSIPADTVEEMSDRDRLCYVARLLMTLAHAYGVYPGVNRLVPAETPLERYDRLERTATSPAALLRGLLDISWLPS